MKGSRPHRMTAALAASAAASVLAAAPALATEPGVPAPAPLLPSGVGPVTFAPVPTPIGPAGSAAARMIRGARLVPRRVRRGHRSLLKISLTAPSRLEVVMRRPGGRGVLAFNVPAAGSKVTLRLPARSHGHLLRPGRYRIGIVAIDAQGARSRPVVRTLIVRRAR